MIIIINEKDGRVNLEIDITNQYLIVLIGTVSHKLAQGTGSCFLLGTGSYIGGQVPKF